MRISSSDIKVEENYPEQCKCDEEIKRTTAKWILDQQIYRYGEEDLKRVYPIWISINELTHNGTSNKSEKSI